MKIRKKVISFFLNYLPLQIWTMKICNHDISKTITARSFKLGQLIEEVDQLVKIKEKVILIFFELSLFADLDFKKLYS